LDFRGGGPPCAEGGPALGVFGGGGASFLGVAGGRGPFWGCPRGVEVDFRVGPYPSGCRRMG